MTTVEADGVPIVLVDALILAAVGIPEMLLGLREHPTAAPFQAKQRPKCGRLRLSLASRRGFQLGQAPKLTAKATGKIMVNPTYKLKPKKVKLAAGKTKTLELRPNKAKARKIATALKRGEKAKAKVTVKLTDLAGNTETEMLRVRLKRG